MNESNLFNETQPIKLKLLIVALKKKFELISIYLKSPSIKIQGPLFKKQISYLTKL